MKHLNRSTPAAYTPRKTKNERLANAARWTIACVILTAVLVHLLTK